MSVSAAMGYAYRVCRECEGVLQIGKIELPEVSDEYIHNLIMNR